MIVLLDAFSHLAVFPFFAPLATLPACWIKMKPLIQADWSRIDTLIESACLSRLLRLMAARYDE